MHLPEGYWEICHVLALDVYLDTWCGLRDSGAGDNPLLDTPDSKAGYISTGADNC